MMDDLGLDAKDGRPVDPQVPGTVQDMDAAVAALLAKHDATRTDGKPPWPPSWAMYGTMWEERDKALREVDRLRLIEEWAQGADHCPGCSGGYGDQYRCKCGRRDLFG